MSKAIEVLDNTLYELNDQIIDLRAQIDRLGGGPYRRQQLQERLDKLLEIEMTLINFKKQLGEI